MCVWGGVKLKDLSSVTPRYLCMLAQSMGCPATVSFLSVLGLPPVLDINMAFVLVGVYFKFPFAIPFLCIYYCILCLLHYGSFAYMLHVNNRIISIEC